jgi:nitrogenase subunit NifH
MAKDDKEPKIIFDKIKQIAQKNMGTKFNIELLGQLTSSKIISSCIKQRKLFVTEHPFSNEASNMNEIVKKIVYSLERKVLKDNSSSFSTFFKKIISKF